MNKRLLSILLVIALCLGMMPAAVSEKGAEAPDILPRNAEAETPASEEELPPVTYYAGTEAPAEEGAVTFHPYVFEVEGTEVRASVKLENGLMNSGVISNDVAEAPPENITAVPAPPKNLSGTISGGSYILNYVTNYPTAEYIEIYAYTLDAGLVMEGNPPEIINGTQFYLRGISTSQFGDSGVYRTTLSEKTYVSASGNLYCGSNPDPQPGEILYFVVEEFDSSMSVSSGLSNVAKMTVMGGDDLTKEELKTLTAKDVKAKQLNGNFTGTVGVSVSWTGSSEVDSYNLALFLMVNNTPVKLQAESVSHRLEPEGPGVSAKAAYKVYDNGTCSFGPMSLDVLPEGEEQYIGDSGEIFGALYVKDGDILVVRLEGNVGRTGQYAPPANDTIVIRVDSGADDRNATRIIAEDAAFKAGQEADYSVILTDDAGTVIPGAGLNMTLQGGVIGAVTDEKGVATFGIGALSAGNYTAVIEFEGDKLYQPCNATASIYFERSASEITVKTKSIQSGKKTKYEVTLKTEDGDAIQKAKITLQINGKTYSAKTNEEGVATFTLPKLKAGKYKTTIKFKGNEENEPAKKEVTIKAVKTATKIKAGAKTFKKSVKTKKYQVTLTDVNGKAIKNAKITLKVNGKTYTAKTNAKGVATFKIKNLKKEGAFKAVIKYAGNQAYKAASKTVKIKVK